MKDFAALLDDLARAAKAPEKAGVLRRYLEGAPARDAAWAVYLLGGWKLKRLVPPRKLRAWAARAAGIAEWLFDESCEAVGDAAETVDLVLPPPSCPVQMPLAGWVEKRLLPFVNGGDGEKRAAVVNAWNALPEGQRYLWNRLVTGTFRGGVSRQTLVRALSELGGIEAAVVAGRLAGAWRPSGAFFRRLLSSQPGEEDAGRPMPFSLASPLEEGPESLGDIRRWQAEWKWDGIRAQLIRRGGKTHLWSRAGEPLSGGFPEIERAGGRLPEGTVIDGEILPGREEPACPSARRQKREGPAPKVPRAAPAAFIAFDLLEQGGDDIRSESLAARRRKLEGLIGGLSRGGPLILSPVIEGRRWDDLAAAREESRDPLVEGLMIKRKNSPYRSGRHRGDWWKWKANPFTVDAVLMNARAARGKPSGPYGDYTFGVWHEGALVPVARARAGLTEVQTRRLDSFIRRNTLETFGPVRTVRPAMVFEIAFEGISPSPRRTSGVVLRNPRITRPREKPVREADTLGTLLSLLPGGHAPALP